MPPSASRTAPVGELRRIAVARLSAAGVASPEAEVRELLDHALAIPDGAPGSTPGLTPAQTRAFARLVAQRERRIPLQHLTGTAYFRYLRLAVGPGVFIPRPETEITAQVAIDEARRLTDVAEEPGGSPPALRSACGSNGFAPATRVGASFTPPHPRVVDLGSGSGAIALAVALEVPAAEVHAVEKYPPALAWLRRNARGTRIRVLAADFADCLPTESHSFDVVVSNPPYIPADAVPRDPEVADFDPPTALFGGPDGTDAIRALLQTAARILRPGGLVIVEHGEHQVAALTALLAASGHWTEPTVTLDLNSRPRVTSARRAP